MSIWDCCRWAMCCSSGNGREANRYPVSVQNHDEYLRYLAAANQGASLFPREQAQRLIDAQPGLGCIKWECRSDQNLSVTYRACCGSPLTSCAIGAGFVLGSSSALVGPASGYLAGKIGLLVLAALFAGCGNASGTCLSLWDTVKRDNQQDMAREVNELFKDLSLYMIGEYLRRQGASKTEMIELAHSILENQTVLEREIAKYLRPEESGLSFLFQAATYIQDGTRPGDVWLTNEIDTVNSPNMQQHQELAKRVEAAEAALRAAAEREQRLVERLETFESLLQGVVASQPAVTIMTV